MRVDTACLLADARAPEDPVLILLQSSPVTKSRLSVGGSPLEPEVGVTEGDEEGAVRKEAKRRLLDDLEPFAPKRRSTRVS